MLILVCAASIARHDCAAATALDVIRGPASSSALECAMHGQAYLAGTAIGRGLGPEEWIKVVCRPRHDAPRDAG